MIGLFIQLRTKFVDFVVVVLFSPIQLVVAVAVLEMQFLLRTSCWTVPTTPYLVGYVLRPAKLTVVE